MFLSDKLKNIKLFQKKRFVFPLLVFVVSAFAFLVYYTILRAASPSNPSSLAQTRIITSSSIANGAWTKESTVKIFATSTDVTDGDRVKLYYELIPNGSSFTTAVTEPTTSCAAGTPYSDCTSKIWRNYTTMGASGGWYDESLGHRVPLVIPAANVDSALTNFPVYLDLAILGASHPFWTHARSNGGDIVMVDSSNLRVPVEVVSISTTAHTGEVYFRASSLSSTAANNFYLYYGSSTAAQPAYGATYGSRSVWSNEFVSVWHFQQATGNLTDSVSGLAGTPNGNLPDSRTGKIGLAHHFDGAGDYIQTNSNALNSTAIANFTWSAWFDADSTAFSFLIWEGDVSQNGWGSGQEAHMHFGHLTTNNYIGMYFGDTEANSISTYTAFTDTVSWHQAVGVFSTLNTAPAGRFYLDGVSIATDSGTAMTRGWDTNMRFGRPGTNERYFTGFMDEVRIASTTRTAQWVSTEYDNMNNNATFFSTLSARQESTSTPIVYDDYQSITGIPDSSVGYKWQVFSCDENFSCAAWVPFNVTTPNFRVDATRPTAPGNMTVSSYNSTSINLNFGATSTETNFDEYKIFYRKGTSAPTEADTLFGSSSDADLGNIDYNGTAGISVTGLDAGSQYSFVIYAYDQAGNKASSSPLIGNTNSLPISSFNSAVEKINGSGVIDISFDANDLNYSDLLRAKIEYVAGAACNFTSPLDPTLDETDANTTASYGDPKTENDGVYQLGNASGWITLNSGTTTVNFDWLSQSDIPTANGIYCLRLTVSDGIEEQSESATTTLYIDNQAPTGLGNLTLNSKSYDSVTLNFGAAVTETNFDEYKIYYKQGSSGVGEGDSVHGSSTDADLGYQNYNGTASTIISGLESGIQYVFELWAYDDYGNKVYSNEIAVTTDYRPTVVFNSAAEKTNGSGRVDISLEIDHQNNIDTIRVKLEYEAGAACSFATPLDPTLDTNVANISADYGLPSINNSVEYQIGQSGAWILTSYGSNTVNFDWLSQSDIPQASSTYCLRATAYDGSAVSIPVTRTLTVDNYAPSVPGNLSINTTAASNITLNFGAQSSDTNFSDYKIYYKPGSSGVTESDSVWDSGDDIDLNAANYGGTSNTTVTGLADGIQYVFNIWAYDDYGNKSNAASEIAVTTRDIPGASTGMNQSRINGISITNGAWVTDDSVRLGATSTDIDGDEIILYFNLATTSGSYVSSISEPADACDSGTAYGSCPGRIWSNIGYSEIGNWYDLSYSHRTGVSALASEVNANLTAFPVYIDLSILGSAHPFWDNVRSDGGDILVTDSSGVRLPLEIVSFSTSTHSGELYFRASLTDLADTNFWIYYGSSTAAQPAVGDSDGRNAVWSNNYKMVWHMESASTITDSTGNGMTGTNSGADSYAAGRLGAALDFVYANSDSIQTGLLTSELNTNINAMTISLWAYSDVTTNDRMPFGTHTNRFYINQYNTGNWTIGINTLTNQTTGQTVTVGWQYLNLVMNGGTASLYKNATAPTSNTAYSSYTPSNSPRVGSSISGGTPTAFYDGKIDEFRVAYSVHDQAWISTEYNNMNDNAAFFSTSTDESSISAQAFEYATISSIPDSAAGYKWRVLACDNDGCSPWAAFNATVPNLRIDATAPTAPGALTVLATTTSAVELGFGAQSSESNFGRYRIYYRTGSTTPVMEDDSFWGITNDSNLSYINYNGAASTTITGLNFSTWYTFAIFAFDIAGNFSSSSQVYARTVDPTVNSILSILQLNDGSGDVEISSYLDDAQNDDIRLKVEYETGDSCLFLSPNSATVSEVEASTTAEYGSDPLVDTDENYQVGTSSGWIDTDSGPNVVDFVWQSKIDVPNAYGAYCVRIIVNDNVSDFATATEIVMLDNYPPQINSVYISNGSWKIGDDITLIVNDDAAGYVLSPYSTVNEVADLGFEDSGDGQYIITYTVSEGDTDRSAGTIPISIMLLDSSGNANDPYTSPESNSASIDANKPRITAIELANVAYKIGDVVRATATVESDPDTYTLGTTTINNVAAANLQKINNTTYTFDYTVSEGDTARTAGTIPISLSLVDSVGQYNWPASTTVETNTASIDAVRPVVSVLNWVPSSGVLAIGQSATVTIVTGGSETGLLAGATMTINGVNVAPTFFELGGGQYRVTYTVSDGDTDRADAANLPVYIQVRDAAGNNSNPYSVSNPSVRPGVDGHRPIISSIAFSQTSGVLKIGDSVNVTITAGSSETGLSAGDTMTINGVNVASTFASLGGGQYRVTYTVAPGHTEILDANDLPVNLAIEDAAGNNSNAYTTASPSTRPGVDSGRPVISSVVFEPSSGYVAIGMTATATITVANSETGLLASSSMLINNVNVGLTMSEVGGGQYTVAYTVSEGDNTILDSQNLPISLALIDAAGNSSLAYTVASTSTRPGVSGARPVINSVSFAPTSGILAVDSTATATIYATALIPQILTAGTTMTINGVDVSGTFVHTTGDYYTVTYTVADGNTDRTDASDLPVAIQVRGLSGNQSNLFTTADAANRPGVDGHRPIISSIAFSQTSGVLKIGDSVNVTITAGSSETGLSAGDTMTINGVNVASTFASLGGGQYRVTYTVAPGHTEILDANDLPVNLAIEDAAGNNSNAYTTASPSTRPGVDSGRPVISSVVFEPSSGYLGVNSAATVTITLAGGELGAAASSTLTVNGKSVSGTFSVIGGGVYSVTYTAAPGDNAVSDSADLPVNIAVVDVNGNSSVPYTTANASNRPGVDVIYPAALGNLTYSSNANNSITFSFGSASSDTNFSQYRIYYRVGTSGVTQSDNYWGPVNDADLGYANYNGTSNTTISGLATSTSYVFRIYAYDAAGNSTAAPAEISASTNGRPDNPTSFSQSINNNQSQIANGSWITSNNVRLTATSSPDSIDETAEVYFELIDNGTSFRTSTSTPSGTCAPDTSYNSCSSKIWYGSPLFISLDWYDSSYSYRVKITANNSQVDADLTNFPVYFDLANFDNANTFWTNVRSTGGDIVITNLAGTRLPLEIVSINTSGHTGEIYFRSDLLENSTSTDFYIYYGSSTAVQPAAAATYGSQSVWSNGYRGVWHLSETSGTAVYDSTSYANNSSSFGGTPTINSAGKVGRSVYFNGTSRILVPTDNDLEPYRNLVTSAWVNRSATQNQYAKPFWYGTNNTSPYPTYGLEFNNDSDTNIRFAVNAGGAARTSPDYASDASTWLYLVGSYDGSVVRLYVNDAAPLTTSYTGTISGYDDVNGLGIGDKYQTGQGFTGYVDELRIASTTRTDTWVSTEYKNMNNNAAFFSTSTQEVPEYTEYTAITSLPDSSAGYKWQIIACSNNGVCSDWVPFNTSTPNFRVDTIAPTAPGALSWIDQNPTEIFASFGATTTELNFDEYKIRYAIGNMVPVPATGFYFGSSSDPNLADVLFNGESSTTIDSLTAATVYTFAVYAYDLAGNYASSSLFSTSTGEGGHAPIALFNSAAQKADSSGRVDISLEVDDYDNDNTLQVKIEYQSGTSCDFMATSTATIDSNQLYISADYGTPIVDNNEAYRIGSSSGYILTSPGSNTINVDWLTKTDLPAAEGYYCLRAKAYDGGRGQISPATTTIFIDNINPTAPGNLTFNNVSGSSLTLNLGSASVENYFSEYKIFYKIGDSGVDEGDMEYVDANLNYRLYNGASTVTISSLTLGLTYAFNIWAYDVAGNKAAAAEFSYTLNAPPYDTNTLSQARANGSSIANGQVINETTVEFSAEAQADPNAGDELSFYFEAIDNGSSFRISTSSPVGACAPGTAFDSCSGKIWSGNVSFISSNWYDESYSYRTKITAQNSQVDADLTNFPVYLDLSILSPAHSLWNGVRSNGGDLLITNSSGTRLPLEIVSLNSAEHAGELYFRASLNNTADTDFYIYYGSSTAVQPAAAATYGSQSVWSNGYRGVWHLSETSGTAVYDSTSYANNSSSFGGGPVLNSAGKVGTSVRFSGTSYILIPTDNDLEPYRNLVTSFWMNRSAAQNTWSKPFWYGTNNTSPYPAYGFEFNMDSDTNIRFSLNAGAAARTSPDYASDASTWLYLVGSYDGSVVRLYVNDAAPLTTSYTGTISGYDDVNGLGIGDKYQTGQGFTGYVDELRIASTTRTDTWVSTEYKNMNNNAAFFSTSTGEYQEYAGSTTIISLPDSAAGYKWQSIVCDNDGACSSWTRFNASIPNFTVDITAPSSLGSLTIDSQTSNSITLNFGAEAVDPNFDEYRIYYKAGSSGVTEGDSEISSSSEPDLAYINYNGTATTTVSGLLNGTEYVFNIWAYDDFGLKSSAAEISGYTNFAPTSTFVSAAQKTDGSGRIDVYFTAYDFNQDNIMAKLDYVSGSACNFAAPLDPTLSELTAYATSTYGDPAVENDNFYQIGNSTGWIITSSGQNTVSIDWLSELNLPAGDGIYCLRLTTNDQVDGQITPATTTVTVDNVAPTAAGALLLDSFTANSLTLSYGSSSSDSHFDRYRIFYKSGLGDPIESDSEHVDSDLLDINYNNTATTTISGLTPQTYYSFVVWAYDDYGKKSTSSKLSVQTDAAPAVSFNSASQKVNGSGIVDISLEVYDFNGDQISAKIEYVAGEACNFTVPLDPALDTANANITADYGDPDINNSAEYQIGYSNKILTFSGSNTVNFDWFTASALPAADGIYCLRATALDPYGAIGSATTTLIIDNVAPSGLGSLSIYDVDGDDVFLQFGSQAVDANFSEYIIYYKLGTNSVSEADADFSRLDDLDLGYVDYNGTATTVITSLVQLSDYVFNIWAYDEYGNKASGTSEVSTTTEFLPQATWREAEDVSDPTVGVYLTKESNVRARIALANTGDWVAQEQRFLIQYAPIGSGCSNVSSWNKVPAVEDGSDFVMISSDYFIDQESTVQRFANSEGYEFTAGSLVEYPSNISASSTLSENQYTEIEYAFMPTADAVAGETYCFRLISTTTGENLDTYGEYAEITIAPVPTAAFVSAVQRSDGSDLVDISVAVDSEAGLPLVARIDYEAGSDCNFTAAEDPTLNEADADVTATYGDPDIDNDEIYQIGSTTANMLITQYGQNTVNFDWPTAADLTAADGIYCLRLLANDGFDDSLEATTTLILDHVNPTNPGDLTAASKTSESVTISFGSPASDNNFSHYIIYYKQSNGGVTESDNSWDSSDDPNLANVNFNGAGTTIIDGLTTNLYYTFKIWAYDDYGNKSSSSNELVVLLRGEGRSQNWQFFEDQYNETPVLPLAALNTAPSSISSGRVVKLRLNLKEIENITMTNSKTRLQYSTYSNFSSNVNFVDEANGTADWVYADGIDENDSLITTMLLASSTIAGRHNESGTAASTFNHLAGETAELEFTIKYNESEEGIAYYFRAYSVNNDEPEVTIEGYSYPSIITGTSSLIFSSTGIASGEIVEGVQTNVNMTLSNVDFGLLTPGNEKIGAQRLSITTNTDGGYQLFVYQDQELFSNNGATIDPLSSTNEAPSVWPDNPSPSGFGYHSGDDTLSGVAPSRFAPNNTYARFETALKEVAYSQIPVNNDIVDMVFRIEVSNGQEAGDYRNNIVYILVPTY